MRKPPPPSHPIPSVYRLGASAIATRPDAFRRATLALHAARLLALFVLVDADLGALLGCLGPLLMVGWWVWGEVSGVVRDGVGCIVLFCIVLYCFFGSG